MPALEPVLNVLGFERSAWLLVVTNVFVAESMLDVSALVSVAVTVNGQSLGSRQLKCESRLRELDRILRAHDNPFLFLCQVIGEGSPRFTPSTTIPPPRPSRLTSGIF